MDIYFILLSSNPLVLNFIVHIVASGALSVDSWIPFSFPSSNVAVFIFVFLTFPYIHYFFFFLLKMLPQAQLLFSAPVLKLAISPMRHGSFPGRMV